MEIKELLAVFGLTDKKADIYLAALEIGPSSAISLAERASIKRTTVYDIIEELKRLGLIIETIRGKRTRYAATDPDRLKDLVRRQSLTLEALLPQLKALYNVPGVKPGVRYFEGLAGVQAALEDTLSAQDKTLLGILSMEDLYETIGEAYMEDYVKRRIALGYKLRVVRSQEKEVAKRWPSSKKEHRDRRYAPKGYIFDMTQYVYDNKVLLLSSRKENFAMVVESADYARNQRQLFEALWQVSQPAP